jgi:uncharacterized surface protein with fasciclin (FAS1) repeats
MTDRTATITPAGSVPAAAPAALKDLVDTAVSNGSFGTLTKAIGFAGLGSTLKGPGPYTVFAPTDSAFKSLPSGALDAMLKDMPKLSRTLSYHVVPGRFTAADLKAKADSRGMVSLKTVTGSMLSAKVTDAGVSLGVDHKVKVTTADVMASNGVIHVIDGVLTPVI